ncbi:hypothetical protein NC981_24310 [Leptolyngbya sp. DQ-M1]|uniref:hypothetical protein n=1 Tax=Leptolyngbya sp. DQ-M1 TaxID=2933920 RepID=UPI0032994142
MSKVKRSQLTLEELIQWQAAIADVATLGISAISVHAAPDRWEYMGIASTGEKVYLNLDSIQLEPRRAGYFFTYQIGNDRPVAFTNCDGQFQVADRNGIYGGFMKPQSEAIRKMLGRACTYRAR